jgi:hypothetical protein
MKPSKTTLAGSAAAVAVTVAAFTGETSHIHQIAELSAAVALALLGKHAAECPANCPGTDENRHPRPWQRDLFHALALVAITAAACVVLSGCATKNPAAGPDNPTAPAYIVDPRLGSVSNTVHGVATVLAPVAPGGAALPSAVEVVFGAVGALSLLYARHKSEVANALASSIARSGEAVTKTVHYNAGATMKPEAARVLITKQANRVRPPQDPARNLPVDRKPDPA